MQCLQHIIELGRSIRATAGHFGIYRSTLRRWERGFSRHNEIAKWAWFFHGDLPRAPSGLGPSLLKRFRTMGTGDLTAGAAAVMICLHEGFCCRLY